MFDLQTLQLPPSFEQFLQYLQFLQAEQFFPPEHLPANDIVFVRRNSNKNTILIFISIQFNTIVEQLLSQLCDHALLKLKAYTLPTD